MDRQRFDSLARQLAGRKSRRQALATIAGVAVATVGVPSLIRSASAQAEGCVITCPPYGEGYTAEGTCAGIAVWEAPTDNGQCGETPTITCDYESGSSLPGGFGTEVTCSLDSDPEVTCSFNAYVLDSEPPVITCPADISEVVTGPTSVSFDDPLVTDNCNSSYYTWECDSTTGDTFPIGTTTVTCQMEFTTSGKQSLPLCTFDITLVVPTETSTPEPTTTATEVPTNQPTTVDPTATDSPSTESPATTVPESTATTAPVTSLPNTGSGGSSNGTATKLLPIAIVGGGAALLTRLGLRAQNTAGDTKSN